MSGRRTALRGGVGAKARQRKWHRDSLSYAIAADECGLPFRLHEIKPGLAARLDRLDELWCEGIKWLWRQLSGRGVSLLARGRKFLCAVAFSIADL